MLATYKTSKLQTTLKKCWATSTNPRTKEMNKGNKWQCSTGLPSKICSADSGIIQEDLS
jgi:hypothetical protein